MTRLPFPRIARALALAALALAGASATATAQNLFAPVAKVDDMVVTRYEFQQRRQMLQALRAPGDLDKTAMDRLIDERLQVAAARRAGITLSEEDIAAGIEDFASRLEMSREEFIAFLAEQGVAEQSFRDFIVAGLMWREYVRARFAPRVEITEAEIDRAIRLRGTTGSARVKLSEIFLPTATPQFEAQARQLAPQIAALRSIEEFADAARRFSAGPSAPRGGEVEDWIPLENLPPQLRQIILTMKPGEVTDPIEIPNALALFQLRAIEPTAATPPANPSVDYASYLIPGGRSPEALAEARRVAALADTCDDLYGILRDRPPEVLERRTMPLARVPADVAIELAKLDPGESSVALTRDNGATLVFLMLCERLPGDAEEISREEVRLQLRNQRLAAMAEAYLEKLRAEAVIVRP